MCSDRAKASTNESANIFLMFAVYSLIFCVEVRGR